MKRRDKCGRINDILRCAINGVCPTRLMQCAYLSWQDTKKYTSILSASGLISNRNEGRHLILQTTEKGYKFMKLWDGLKQLLETTK